LKHCVKDEFIPIVNTLVNVFDRVNVGKRADLREIKASGIFLHEKVKSREDPHLKGNPTFIRPSIDGTYYVMALILNIHHKIIEYTPQDFLYTSQDIKYTSQNY
jgi:hypothetical protein